MRRSGNDPGSPPPEPDITASLPSLVLLSRMKEGSDAARDELVRRYWPRLERWARGRLPAVARDLYETDDLVQETMLAALRRLDRFEPQHPGALPAYFRAAILNRIRTLAVRTKARGENVGLESGIADAGPSPLEEALGIDALKVYETSLARLRSDDREAIQLKVELGLSYPEIARELGKPSISAARMAVSRALYRLAIEMGRHG